MRKAQPPQKGCVHTSLEEQLLYRGTCLLPNADGRDCNVSNVKDLPGNVFGAGLVTLKAALAGNMAPTLILANTLTCFEYRIGLHMMSLMSTFSAASPGGLRKQLT